MNEKSLTEMTHEAVKNTKDIVGMMYGYSIVNSMANEQDKLMIERTIQLCNDWFDISEKYAEILDEINNKLDKIQTK